MGLYTSSIRTCRCHRARQPYSHQGKGKLPSYLLHKVGVCVSTPSLCSHTRFSGSRSRSFAHFHRCSVKAFSGLRPDANLCPQILNQKLPLLLLLFAAVLQNWYLEAVTKLSLPFIAASRALNYGNTVLLLPLQTGASQQRGMGSCLQ